MNARPVAEVCPNCGAPWDPSEGGTCPWCQARIRAQPPAGLPFSFLSSQAGLVPDDVDDCWSSAPFIYLMLSVLGSGLSSEPAVQGYAGSEPGLREQIRTLSAAVSEAGVRVRDAGLLKGAFDQNLRVYTPAEIWTFDLAVDVIAMLGALEGLPASKRATVAGNVRSLDRDVHSHSWKKELKKAGAGPEGFRELRAKVPRHAPRPP